MTIETVHGSAVLVEDRGVLIRGPSGSGKSSLVLRLMERSPRRTWLVSDDRVLLSSRHGRLIAAAPPSLAGRIEVRGQGIKHIDFVSPAVIHLIVDLVPRERIVRLPEPEDELAQLDGIELPLLMIAVDHAAATDRIWAKLFFNADDGLL